MVRRDWLVTVPHGNISKANKLPAYCINGQNRMYKNPTKKAATANRIKASLPNLSSPQNNVACILNGQNVPAPNPFSGSSPAAWLKA